MVVNNKDSHLALEDFFRREYRSLYNYVYRIVGNPDDSCEVLQETFLRFFKVQSGKRTHDDDGALLFNLARNVAIDVLRKSRTREAYEKEVQEGKVIVFGQRPSPTPEQVLLQKERQCCAERALGLLNKKEQECLALRSSGLSYQKVAAALSLSPESIGPLVARALRRFRGFYVEILEKKGQSSKARPAGRR